jgi:hypothetical protein
VVNGLFGLDMYDDQLHLTPRLGMRDGYVRVYQAAGDVYAAYQYDPSPTSVVINYGTNMPTAPSLHVPLQWTGPVTAWLDGTDQLPVQVGMNGEDVLASVVVPSGMHRVEFRQSSTPPDTLTPTPSPTAAPTDTATPTPVPPTATPQPSATATATPSPSPTATQTATATPNPHD